MSYKSATLPPSPCPGCGQPLGGKPILGIGPQGRAAPTAGDITVCCECGEILIYNAELRLARITIQELEAFRQKTPQLCDMVEMFSAKLRAIDRASRN